jgi:uncharacterized membrane protein YfcA
MALSRLIHLPGFVRWGIHLDIAPQWPWLALQGLALWPVWVWMSQHLFDRADNSLGLLALGAGVVLTWRQRQRLRVSPGLAWLACALAGTALASVTYALESPEWAKLIALLALAAGLRAFWPPSQRLWPWCRHIGAHASRVAGPIIWINKLFGNTFVNRVCHKAAFLLAMLALLTWSLVNAQ